jgi:putative PIN family toxin of toxin-antitoxin system
VRIVLDTNIWLDWFVFNDPTINTLKTWSAKPENTIVIDEACKQELISVLAYEKFQLNTSHRIEIARNVDKICEAYNSYNRDRASLEVWCKDPADEKFLKLALNSDSDFLVTKDWDLLKRKNYRVKNFNQRNLKIITPISWNKQYSQFEQQQSSFTQDIS